MIVGHRHTCLLVRNLERSLRFYRDLLGLTVTKRLTIDGGYVDDVFGRRGVKLTYVKLQFPGREPACEPPLELHYWHRPRRLPARGFHHISFTVTDLAGEYRRLKRRGVRFLSKPLSSPYAKTRLCFCCDPDGNLIELIEDK